MKAARAKAEKAVDTGMCFEMTADTGVDAEKAGNSEMAADTGVVMQKAADTNLYSEEVCSDHTEGCVYLLIVLSAWFFFLNEHPIKFMHHRQI